MKRTQFLIMSFTFIPWLLMGCQGDASKQKNTDTSMQQVTSAIKIEGTVKEIIISPLKEGNTIVLDDAVAIENMRSIISSSIEQDGIVNMSNPDYSIDIILKDEVKQSFYLWVGKDLGKSLIMKADDTHTTYVLLEEETKQLYEYVGMN